MEAKYLKTVGLNSEQYSFFEDNDINFSKWIRRLVDAAIELRRKNLNIFDIINEYTNGKNEKG